MSPNSCYILLLIFSNISPGEPKEEVKPMQKRNESGMMCIYNYYEFTY